MRRFRSKKFTLKSKIIGLALLALAVFALPATALAHPLGNFTVNHYSRLEVGAAGVNIFFVLDMAEIPTFQEKDLIDLNQDGQISPAEQAQYLDAKLQELQSNLTLAIDNKPVELKTVARELTFLTGQGGLQTMRLTAHFQTPALAVNAASLTYQDSNYADRLGWREIVLRNATGVNLTQSSVSDQDQTNELRVYPQDMLASPLAVTEAKATFKIDPSVVVNRPDYAQDSAVIKTQDPLANLINGELTLPLILFGLAASIVLGMFHALSPGHGKTVVAAYLVGSRGTARHAVFLGVTVTITHTIGVFALGLITLFASQYILPEKLYPWLGLLSGLIVLGMGLALFRARLNSARLKGPTAGLLESAGHTHTHAGHEHSHTHNDSHTHDRTHDHSHTQGHEHGQPQAEPLVIGRGKLEPALALAGGQPELRAAAETFPPHSHTHDHSHSQPDHDHEHGHSHFEGDPHTHDHDHDHEHGHSHEPAQPAEYVELGHDHAHSDGYSHEPTAGHAHTHNHDHYHEHSPENGLVHSHGGKMHSHLPPGSDGTTVTWKSLLIFGISAGLLPCPSALILMLSAISLNRTALGLLMIIFFSFGLAGTLTLVGLLLVYARDKMGNLKLGAAGKVMRLLPIVSAALVSILGLAITYEGLLQVGFLK
jgi:ABC-type nickel/cobalt efflux system permease component RcnA